MASSSSKEAFIKPAPKFRPQEFCLELLTLDELIPQVRQNRKKCPSLIPLTKDRTVIGRTNSSGKSDFQIDFRGISSEHAQIIRSSSNLGSSCSYRFTIVDLKPDKSGGMVVCEKGCTKWIKKYQHELSLDDKVSFGIFGKLAVNASATPKHLRKAQFSYQLKQYSASLAKKHKLAGGKAHSPSKRRKVDPEKDKTEMLRLRKELEEIKRQNDGNVKRAEDAEKKHELSSNLFSEQLSEHKKRALEEQEKTAEEHRQKRKKFEEEAERKLKEKTEEIHKFTKEVDKRRRESLEKDQLVEMQKKEQKRLKQEMEQQKEEEKKKSKAIEELKKQNEDLQKRVEQTQKRLDEAKEKANEAIEREQASLKLIEESKKQAELAEQKNKEEKESLHASHEKEALQLKKEFEEIMKKSEADKGKVEREYQKQLKERQALQQKQMDGMKVRHRKELKKRQKDAKRLVREQEKAKLAKIIAQQEELLLTQEEELSCAICFEIMVEPRSLKECRDTFCRECIADWLRDNRNCPACRHNCSSNSMKRNKIVESSIEKYQETKKLLEAQKNEAEAHQTKDEESDEAEDGEENDSVYDGDHENPCTGIRKNLVSHITVFLDSKKEFSYMISYLKDVLESTYSILGSDPSKVYLVFDCLKAICEELMRHMNQIINSSDGRRNFDQAIQMLVQYYIKALLHDSTLDDVRAKIIATAKALFLDIEVLHEPVIQAATNVWTNEDLCNVLKGEQKAMEIYVPEPTAVCEVRTSILCSQKRWQEGLNYAKAVKQPAAEVTILFLSGKLKEGLEHAKRHLSGGGTFCWEEVYEYHSVLKPEPSSAFEFLSSLLESAVPDSPDILKVINLIISLLSSLELLDSTKLCTIITSKVSGIANFTALVAEMMRQSEMKFCAEFGYHCLEKVFQNLGGETAQPLVRLANSVVKVTVEHLPTAIHRLSQLLILNAVNVNLPVVSGIAKYLFENNKQSIAFQMATAAIEQDHQQISDPNRLLIAKLEEIRFHYTKALPITQETITNIQKYAVNALRMSRNAVHYHLIEQLSDDSQNAISPEIFKILQAIPIQDHTVHTYFVALKQGFLDMAAQIVSSSLPAGSQTIRDDMVYLRNLVEGISKLTDTNQRNAVFSKLTNLLISKLNQEYLLQVQNQAVDVALSSQLHDILAIMESSISPIIVAKFYQQFCALNFPTLVPAHYRIFCPYFQKIQHFYTQAHKTALYHTFCSNQRRTHNRQYVPFNRHYGVLYPQRPHPRRSSRR